MFKHYKVNEHDHIVRIGGLTTETKNEIEKMLMMQPSIAPSKIILNIEKLNDELRAYNKSELKIPKIRCLYTFIARYKARKYGQTK